MNNSSVGMGTSVIGYTVGNSTSNFATASKQLEVFYIVLVTTHINMEEEGRNYKAVDCTGTMIRNDLVVTTVGCVRSSHEEEPNPDNTIVKERSQNILRAHKIFFQHHDESDHLSLAVIVTEKSAQTVFPSIPHKMIEPEVTIRHCFLGGFGMDVKVPVLRNFNLLSMNRSDVEVTNCNLEEGGGKPRRICLHFMKLVPCSGDWGSPLICKGQLYAIFTPTSITDTQECLERYVSVFTPLFPFVKWIDHIMKEPATILAFMSNPIYVLLVCISILAILGGLYCAIVELLPNVSPADNLESQSLQSGKSMKLDLLNLN